MRALPMRLTALTVAALAVFGVPGAHAAFIVNFKQVGNDVIASGSGTVDLSGFTFFNSSSAGTGIIANEAVLGDGSSASNADYYTGVVGPMNFGSGGDFFPTSTTGALVGVEGGTTPAYLVVPHGFVSGASLTATDTFANSTFASLGLTSGQYVYGSSLAASDLIINIPAAAVPEPASLAILTVGIVGIAFARRRSAFLAGKL